MPFFEWDLVYTKAEQKWTGTEPGKYREDQWYQLQDRRIVIPAAVATELVTEFHKGTHMWKTAIEKELKRHFYNLQLPTLAQFAVSRRVECVQNNPRQGPVSTHSWKLLGQRMEEEKGHICDLLALRQSHPEEDWTNSQSLRIFMDMMFTKKNWLRLLVILSNDTG